MRASMTRRSTVSGRSAQRVATSHKPIEIAIVAISFVRPRSPSDRRRMILVQSSAKPSSAHASATPNTPIARGVNSVSSRNGTAIAVKMMIPPMVGVPALAWCSCGPSSRICCPNSFSRRKEMNLGDRKMQMSSEAVPAIRTSPMGRVLVGAQRLGDDLQADAARALDQQDPAGGEQRSRERGGLARVGDRVALAVVAVEHPGGACADRDQHVDPGRGGIGADVAVVLVLARAELEHVTEDRQAPAG